MIGSTVRNSSEIPASGRLTTILTSAGPNPRWLVSPSAALAHFWRHRSTIRRAYQGELNRVYAGTVLGLGLSVLQSLAILGIYAAVFSIVFQARWPYPHAANDNVSFGVILFAGLLVFDFFAESVAGSVGLIRQNAQLVTKVVFPVEMLPVSVVMRTGTVSLISIAILIAAVFAVTGEVPTTAPLGLLLLASFALFVLGVSFVMSAIGTYFRDLAHLVTILIRALVFATPIFYAVEQVPPAFQTILYFNPLTWAVEASRMLLALGLQPPLSYVVSLLVAGPLCAYLGLLFFFKLRRGFGDVL